MDANSTLVLTHHGVKGMKWGVRRNRSSGVDVASKPKKVKTPKVKVHELSDDELKKRISRLEMEKKYKDLSPTKHPVKEGKKIAGEVLKNSGKNAATTVLTAAAVYGLKKGIEKQFGLDVKTEIFPKKK